MCRHICSLSRNKSLLKKLILQQEQLQEQQQQQPQQTSQPEEEEAGLKKSELESESKEWPTEDNNSSVI